jgi:CheY-like chemotaxis protein
MSNRKGIEILLVEDSPSDAFISAEALRKAKALYRVHVVRDGVEAMAFLRRESPYGEAPRPDIVLLDLNMPRKDGREVLAEMKSDNKLKSIPVVVLSSSGAEQDIANAYSLHANCYLTKPADFGRFKEMIASIESFWFQHVTFPPHD